MLITDVPFEYFRGLLITVYGNAKWHGKKKTKTKKLTEPVFVLHKYSMRSGGGMGDLPSTWPAKICSQSTKTRIKNA